jgi:single-stranded DNA-binding protein
LDLNLVVIAGKLAATPEVRVFEGGSTLVRILVTTRTGGEGTGKRQRLDVVPVVMWDVKPGHAIFDLERGDRVWVAGAIQRRFWSDDNSRRSRIEVVAEHVQSHVDWKASGEEEDDG